MNYEAIQIVEERINQHKIKQRELVVVPGKDDDLSPVEKEAIRNERKIEDALVEELEDLRRQMMRN